MNVIMDCEINVCGTSLKGYFPDDTQYKDLVKVFGEPTTNDGYKTDAEWIGKIDDKVFTIYNYKTGYNYLGKDGLPVEEITDWHIGGKENIAYELINYFENKLKGK